MPELPEVETVVRALRARLTGQRIDRIVCLFPGVLVIGPGTRRADVRGSRITGLRRRGKLALVDLDQDRIISVHLRMTGRLDLALRAEDRPRHTHVVIELQANRELRFVDPRRFGRVELRTPDDLAATAFLRTLGPEPFELGVDGLSRRLAARTGTIKGALLDQKLVAGLGNIYVDEILFRAKVDPRLVANRLRPAEVREVEQSMREVLAEAIAAGGSTLRDYRSLDGRRGEFQGRHLVFGREGLPCTLCGEAIRKIRVAGRGTHFCPRCQPRRRRVRRPARREPMPGVEGAGR